MNIQDFFNKYNGKGIDYDGYYGFQCVDLYRQYVKECLEYPQSPGVVGAADIWNTYLKDKYERIKDDPTAVPKLGDIIIWSKDAGGGYGHVAVFSSGDVNSFISFDQGWPVGILCHFQSHNYTNVLGWLRPNKFIDETPTPIEFNDQTIIPIGEPWGNIELQAVRSILNDQKRANGGLTQDLKNCQEKPPETVEVIKEVEKFIEPEFDNSFARALYRLALSIDGKA